jgi:hypothetical protein
MCLAIFQPAGKQIPEGHLREGFMNNPHGAGFMYFDENGELCSFRSLEFDKFIDEYETMWAMHGQHSPFAIHFRWATHGTRGIENVHPFRLNEHVAVLHNGIIDCIINDPKMSDTAAFVRDYLGSLPTNWYDNDFLFHMVEDFTSGSKLVIMTNEPSAEYCAYIVNERLGAWSEGIWYSNTSYQCTTRGLLGSKSAKQSAEVFDDEDVYQIDACNLCGEESVLDGLCYTCETCQNCYMTESECECTGASKQLAFHNMTESEYLKHWDM